MLRQSTDLLWAIAAAVRYRIGLTILRLWLRVRRALGWQTTYTQGWSMVIALAVLLRGRADYSNTYHDDWRHFAVLKLLRQLRRDGAKGGPAIEAINLDKFLAAARDPAQRVVVLTPHTRVMSAINKMIYDAGIPLTDIAALAGDGHFQLGFNVPSVVIPIGPTTLVEARRALKGGHVVVACPDFSERRGTTVYHDHFVAPGMFRFAALSNARLFFSYASMTDAGDVQVFFEDAGQTSPEEEQAALIGRFIRFVATRNPLAHDLIAAIDKPQAEKSRGLLRNFSPRDRRHGRTL